MIIAIQWRGKTSPQTFNVSPEYKRTVHESIWNLNRDSMLVFQNAYSEMVVINWRHVECFKITE